MKITLTKEVGIKDTWYYVNAGSERFVFLYEKDAQQAYERAIKMQKTKEVTVIKEYDTDDKPDTNAE